MDKIIFTKDNSRIDISAEYSNLSELSDKPLGELVAENPNLLVFPHSLGYSPDLENDTMAFRVRPIVNGNSVTGYTLTTGNIAGYVGILDCGIGITSRFYQSENNDRANLGQDYFISYMLMRVLHLNILDLPFGYEESGTLDILPYLFPAFLHKALTRGILKQYIRYEYNDATPRGIIDISRHFSKNIPFIGNIAYVKREYTANNNLMHLIRHTIEYIKQNPKYSSILQKDMETQKEVEIIEYCTPTYMPQERVAIICGNYRGVRHPLYIDYEPLRILCHKILNHKRVQYDNNDKTINGMLIDLSWLWEEYLNCMLKSMGFVHPNNRTGQGRIFLTDKNAFQRYPDFYLESLSGNIVVDAKYKHEIDRVSDVNQIVTYMYRFCCSCGLLVQPYKTKNLDENIVIECHKLLGYKGILNIGKIFIPQKCENYKSFCDKMQVVEDAFIKFMQNKKSTA